MKASLMVEALVRLEACREVINLKNDVKNLQESTKSILLEERFCR